MKSLLVFVALLFGAMSSFAQGSLTPPGAPGQTMKSLDQIEPRTVIPGGTASYFISAPGSYVLGGNITVAIGNGINLNASNVTLDLNGFTISSTHPTGYGTGILLGNTSGSYLSNIRIFNGNISGTSTYAAATRTFTPGGFVHGIFKGTGVTVGNVEVYNLAVSGVTAQGLDLIGQSVHDCQVNTCGGQGIVAGTISGCVTLNSLLAGILGTNISNCRATSVGQTPTTHGIDGESIADCVGTADAGSGISGTTILNSKGTSVSGRGISAVTAMNCHGTSGSGAGIQSTVVSYSYGSSTSGNAIIATSAIGCVVGSGGVSATNKLLGTP
jgi:hypothetical protein